MTTRFFINTVLFLLMGHLLQAQMPAARIPAMGSSFDAGAAIHDELSADQRQAIVQQLQANEQQLRIAGRLSAQPANTTATLFNWPLRQAYGFYDKGFCGISNYVDHNLAYPNQKLDYNCGARTYDIGTTGYNHQGTDIFLWPFYWKKMNENAVEVIAAAPGVILDKFDGNNDQNCAYCPTCNWNAIYIMHADGSVAWYGHLKKSSITSKAVGQSVAAGEYLATVGSSGNSTGPHLHFEVYTNSSYSQRIDPFAGNCNSLNGLTSWWANQQPYYNSTLSKVMTHGIAPVITTCPTGEATNEKVNFINGDTVLLAGYYRDQQVGQQAIHRVYKPDNSLFNAWTQDFTANYSASYWIYQQILPSNAPAGMWRYEISYLGGSYSTYFSVNSAPFTLCSGATTPLVSNLTGNSYQWQVNMGSGFININDNFYYSGTSSKTLILKQMISAFYGYQFRCVVDGNFSNVITLQFSANWNGSVSTDWEDPLNWDCRTVPDANTDVNIRAGCPNYPLVKSNAVCRSTNVFAGASLQVNSGYTLTLTGK